MMWAKPKNPTPHNKMLVSSFIKSFLGPSTPPIFFVYHHGVSFSYIFLFVVFKSCNVKTTNRITTRMYNENIKLNCLRTIFGYLGKIHCGEAGRTQQ